MKARTKDIRSFFIYGIVAFPLSFVGIPLYIYMPTFYVQSVGLDIFYVGVVLFVSRLIDMFLDPLIGYMSDTHFSRKKMLSIGVLIVLGSFYALAHPPVASYLYLLAFSIAIYLGWSLMSVSYYAIGADIAKSREQNTSYALTRELFNIFGVLSALLIPYTFEVASSPAESLSLLSISLVIILMLVLPVFLISLEFETIQQKVHNLREVLIIVWEEVKLNFSFFSAYFFNNLANAIPATLFLLFIEHVMGAKVDTGMLLILYFFSGIVALPLWAWIAKKRSKKFVWSLSMVIASLSFSVVPFLDASHMQVFIIITVLTGMCVGADMVFSSSIQTDIAQAVTQRFTQLSATLFGIFTMLTKLSLALSVGVSFALLGVFDFVPENPNPDALFALSFLYGGVPVLLKLLALFILWQSKKQTTTMN